MKRQILIIEDEAAIADNIQYALNAEGLDSHWCELGLAGLTLLASQPIDLIILDVGLPDINGFELCKQVRQTSEVPIIFLTARSEEIDRVVGLEIGADDYVAKPFSPRELVARVKAVLKRMTPASAAPLATNLIEQPLSDEQGGEATKSLFEVDEVRAKIKYCATPLDLTPYEQGILTLLIANPERVYSREQLLQQVWAEPEACMDRVVDTHIKSLRGKLRRINTDLEPLKTHRSLGYSLSLHG